MKNQRLNLKLKNFRFRGDFMTLNLEANFNIKFRSKQFLILRVCFQIKNQTSNLKSHCDFDN